MSPVTANIIGYRQLSIAEQAEINTIKEHGSVIESLIASYEGDPSVDQRWLAIARTDLQKGFMALVRSIAQPSSF